MMFAHALAVGAQNNAPVITPAVECADPGTCYVGISAGLSATAQAPGSGVTALEFQLDAVKVADGVLTGGNANNGTWTVNWTPVVANFAGGDLTAVMTY